PRPTPTPFPYTTLFRSIAVGRGQQRGGRLTLLQRHAADLERLGCDSRRDMDRAVVAEELLNRGRHQRRIGLQPSQLIGIAEQRVDRKSTRLNSSHVKIS